MITRFLIAKVPRIQWLMHCPDDLITTFLNYSNVKATWTLLGLKYGLALWLSIRLTRNFSNYVRMFNSSLIYTLSILGMVHSFADWVKLWWAMIYSFENTFLAFSMIVFGGSF